MGACIKKPVAPEPPQEWQTNPLKFIEKLDDVCLLCHEEFDRDFCFAKCCGYFINIAKSKTKKFYVLLVEFP